MTKKYHEFYLLAYNNRCIMNSVQIKKRGERMPKIIENAKEKILEVARKIVVEDGYDTLTIREIANKSDVSIGTVYNYFPNKNALDYELLHFYWKHLMKQIYYSEETSLYNQLKIIFQELQSIINMFTGVFTEFYKTASPSSKTHRDSMFIELTERIKDFLCKSKDHYRYLIEIDKLSQWITLNMVMMCHMNMDYEIFDQIIKKIIMEDD